MTKNSDKRKLTLTIIAASVLIVVCVLVVASLLLTSPLGEKYLKGLLENQLTKTLHQKVSIASLETDIVSYIHAQNVILSQTEDSEPDPVLIISHMEIRYTIWRLLQKEITISSIIIDDVKSNIHRDSLGIINVAILNPQEKENPGIAKSSFKIDFGSVSITNFSFRIRDELFKMNLEGNNLSIMMQSPDIDKFEFNVFLDSLYGLYDNLPIEVTDCQCSGTLEDRVLDIKDFSMAFDSLMMNVCLRLNFDEQRVMQGSLKISGNPNSIVQTVSNRFSIPQIRFSDHIFINLQSSGTFNNPIIFGDLTLPSATINTMQMQKGYMKIWMCPDSMVVDSLNVQAFDGNLSAHGMLTSDSLIDSRLSISITAIDISSLWSALYDNRSPYQGHLNGNISVKGNGYRVENWSLGADVHAIKAKYRTYPLPDFYANLSLSNGHAKIRFHEADFNIEAQADINNREIKGRFTTDIDNLEPLVGLANLFEVQGSVNASGTISGSLDSPEVVAQVECNNLRYQNFPVDILTSKLHYRDKKLYISELNFSGQVDSINKTNPPFHVEDISGGYRYTGIATGSLDSMQSSLSIELIHPRYSKYNLDTATFVISFDGKTISLDSAKIYKDSLAVELNGEFSLSNKKGTANARMFVVPSRYDDSQESLDKYHSLKDQKRFIGELNSSFEIPNLDMIFISADIRDLDLRNIVRQISDTLDVAGILQSKLTFTGNVAKPEAIVEILLKYPRYQTTTLDSIHSTILFDDNTLEIPEIRLFKFTQQLSSKFTIVFQKDSAGKHIVSKACPFKGSIRGEDIDLQLLNPFLRQMWEISGKASLEFLWEGTFESLHPKGFAELKNCRLQWHPETESIDNINLRVTLLDSVFRIENATGSIFNTPFHINASFGIRRTNHVDLDVTCNVADIGSIKGKGYVSKDSVHIGTEIVQMDLSLLQPFLTSIDSLSGMLNCTVLVTGNIFDPDINGNLNIRQLELKLPFLENRFSKGTVIVQFDKNNILIDSVFTKLYGGAILVQGSIIHDRRQIQDINITASADNVTISRPKAYTFNVNSAALSCRRNNDYFRLDGDIQFGESRVIARFKPQSILPWAQKVDHPKGELPDILNKIQLDIRIRESHNLWVDNNLARIRLHTEMGIIGNPARPNLSGIVSLEEGYIIYLDRKFKIKRGTIYFVDPNRFNPEVNLLAETKVTSYQGTTATPYTININVEGPLDEIKVNITSAPPLEQSDIISLLTFGQTRSQLTSTDTETGEGGLKDAIVERAGALSSQRISGFVTRKLGTFLGLDQVTVEGNLFRMNGSTGPQLLASKRVSKRVQLSYSTTVGYINDQSVRLDYLLSRYFSVEGQTDQRGRSSVHLKYRLRFK